MIYTPINKVAIFTTELSYIKNTEYRKNAETLISLLPDYFFEIPASSTNKYHPDFASGDGGLVRHTKVAVRIAKELLDNDSIGYSFVEKERDLILVALLLHDGLKEGEIKNKYTLFDHPLIVCDFIRKHKSELTFKDTELNALTNMIESHMGQWNTNSYSKVVLPKPSNKYQRFVHMCDYLASRKFLDVKFDGFEVEG